MRAHYDQINIIFLSVVWYQRTGRYGRLDHFLNFYIAYLLSLDCFCYKRFGSLLQFLVNLAYIKRESFKRTIQNNSMKHVQFCLVLASHINCMCESLICAVGEIGWE